MSDYTKSTDFASKDSLPSGNAAKIVKGTEIDTEFNNIAVAVATKADLASPGFSGSPTAPTQSSSDSSTKLATTAFVASVIATGIAAAYPVGSIYINASVSTNPATLLGFGTWTAFGAGKVLIGLDSSDALFSTAGNSSGSKDAVVASHTHSASVSDPGHSHTQQVYSGANINVGSTTNFYGLSGVNPASGTSAQSTLSNTTGISVTNSTTGVSPTNANLQPYIVVYMWRRTA
jgi:hypothetical protein